MRCLELDAFGAGLRSGEPPPGEERSALAAAHREALKSAQTKASSAPRTRRRLAMAVSRSVGLAVGEPFFPAEGGERGAVHRSALQALSDGRCAGTCLLLHNL